MELTLVKTILKSFHSLSVGDLQQIVIALEQLVRLELLGFILLIGIKRLSELCNLGVLLRQLPLCQLGVCLVVSFG